jgi:hypothetical protein
MLIIFFDIKGIVHKEFTLAVQSVLHTTETFYGDCMKVCKEVAVASQQCTVSHLIFHRGIFLPKTT